MGKTIQEVSTGCARGFIMFCVGPQRTLEERTTFQGGTAANGQEDAIAKTQTITGNKAKEELRVYSRCTREPWKTRRRDAMQLMLSGIRQDHYVTIMLVHVIETN